VHKQENHPLRPRREHGRFRRQGIGHRIGQQHFTQQRLQAHHAEAAAGGAQHAPTGKPIRFRRVQDEVL
jgi:hypothetical protein